MTVLRFAIKNISQEMLRAKLCLLLLLAICYSEEALTQNSCTEIVSTGTFSDVNTGAIDIFGIDQPSTKGTLFRSNMEVDADGAPDAYHPDNIGSTHICNALSVAPEGQSCKHAVWKADCLADYFKAKDQKFTKGPRICFFAVITKNGIPVLQKDQDPKPGYFISTTALKNPGQDPNSAHGQLDSNEVPYIVLPAGAAKEFSGSGLGDIAVVYRASMDKVAFAVVGDIGPRNKLGEGSIALHKDLGNDPFVLKNGVRRAARGISGKDVVYLIFPTSRGMAKDLRPQSIRQAGATLLNSFGGESKLKACVLAARNPEFWPSPPTGLPAIVH